MFTDRSQLIQDNTPARRYGVAVSDADDDGAFEFLVAGFGSANLMLKWDGQRYVDVSPPIIADSNRLAIAIAAADIDADGYEELYILNNDTYSGGRTHADRLFDFVDETYTDLFEVPRHQNNMTVMSGGSIVALDRFGTGQYGFFITNYDSPMRLYELDDDANLIDMATQAGVRYTTGGRGLIALPIVSDYMDVFAGNENGANFLFRNNGDGTFTDIALDVGMEDPSENVRGIAAVDVGNSRFGLVYGNWQSSHRLFLPGSDGFWDDVAPPRMATPSRIRTVIAADFDNDGYQEIFFNNIGEANRLFAFREGNWRQIDTGDALETKGTGTGAAVADLDGDGRLELLISRGERIPQSLSLYHSPVNDNNWIRILPYSRYGAPARGAVVSLRANNTTWRRVIDAGSGYLCQMEPVAHFGLGQLDTVDEFLIRWTNGTTRLISNPAINQLHRVEYPQ